MKKTSGNNTAGELKVLENSLSFFFLRPTSQATVVVSQASSFSSSRFVHKLNATVKASRTLMLAALFSSYGNRTRLDRFIPVSTALLKKKNSSTVCMHACRCLRRSSVSNRSATALRFFPALSCLLSSWSSFLTVALCFLQSRSFSRQRAKIFKKVCLFLGVGGGLADRCCRWRWLSVSTACDRFIKAAVRVWIGQKPFFQGLDPFQNE